MGDPRLRPASTTTTTTVEMGMGWSGALEKWKKGTPSRRRLVVRPNIVNRIAAIISEMKKKKKDPKRMVLPSGVDVFASFFVIVLVTLKVLDIE